MSAILSSVITIPADLLVQLFRPARLRRMDDGRKRGL